MWQLTGKVALVTGAARGQGRSHAIALASEGADIIAVDLCDQVDSVPYPLATAEDLAETVRQVEALDRRIVASRTDVRDLVALESAVADGVTQLGRLDIAVANAGIFSAAPDGILDERAWQDMIDINLTGVWKTCKVAAPHILAGGQGGSIINIGSTASLKAFNGLPHYVAAKHGVVGLTKALAKEYAPHFIRVNTIAPTNVDTAMIHNSALYGLFLPELENPQREDFAVPAQEMQELPRPWVEPTDISNAVVFLASDQSRYITGITLPVDLGALLK